MRRREFIAGLGSAAAWPVVARAQRAAIRVLGIAAEGYARAKSATLGKNQLRTNDFSVSPCYKVLSFYLSS